MGFAYAVLALMYIRSLVRHELGFYPIRVEVVLVPGLSQIQIIGMADAVIKESSKRILSALRHQGFRIPAGKQVLVNLSPLTLRKKSQGLDLAIALGILLESGQISSGNFDFEKGYCYGALSLKGEVIAPNDLELLNYEEGIGEVLTGPSHESCSFEKYVMKDLGGWQDLQINSADCGFQQPNRPEPLPEKYFSKSLARLMAIVAHGEHSLLVAGAAGGGKTTLVEYIANSLDLPNPAEYRQSLKVWRWIGKSLRQRPVVAPHHSITPMAMIGGGARIVPGEISLAHGGALILDELLEFHPQIQSALREPMEKGVIYLARAGRRQVLPAKSLFLATTNLCPCGEFAPGQGSRCRCSSLKLRQSIEKLSGPFLDRFSVFHILNPAEKKEISTTAVREKISKARAMQSARTQFEVNQSLDEQSLMGQLSVSEALLPYSRSHRRRLSLLRVARSIADLEGAKRIESVHIEEAQLWTSRDSYRIQSFSQENFAMR